MAIECSKCNALHDTCALCAGELRVPHLDRYDAGLLASYGGGNVEWWQAYLRSELELAYEFYNSQLDTQSPAG